MALADGYARLARRPAVVSVHATPGVCNIVGGLFLAKSHHSPVLVLAGQQDSRLLGRRPFLASDLIETVRQHTKLAVQVGRADEVVPTVTRAIRVALEPPAGPVLVAVPKDLHDEFVDVVPEAGLTGGSAVAGARRRPDPKALAAAVAEIARSTAPVIMSGNGVGAAGESAIRRVIALAELIGARVYSEHNATNVHFPSGHRLYLGGNAHGVQGVKPWLEGADLLLAIGCDLFMEDRYVPGGIVPAGCRIVQFDEDPLEIGRLEPVVAGVAGDLVATLDDLLLALPFAMGSDATALVAQRTREIAQLRRKAAVARLRDSSSDATPIRMPRLYAELRAAMPPDAIMVDEAVSMASYLHAFFEFSEADTLLSSKQSWLGWGWGAALGAQLARPDRRVVACLGDGSASYAPQALWTARRAGLPIITVIVDNGGYMAVENHLREFDGLAARSRCYPGTAIGDIDFVALAGAYGVPGRRVELPREIGPALRWALAAAGPAVIHVIVDPDDAGLGRRPIPRPETSTAPG
jgi:benzoylformate decarboxylase